MPPLVLVGILAAALGAGAPPARGAEAPRTPRVLFDEGHQNVHTTAGQGRALAELLRGHGFEVVAHAGALDGAALAGCDVLIVATPRGAAKSAPMTDRRRPAFGAEEIKAIDAWVRAGGGLLLVTDHPPIGDAARPLAERFGVDSSLAFTEDPAQGRPAGSARVPWAEDGRDILFTRAGGGVGDHPVTGGSGPDERVERVATFLGQSLAGPAGSVSFLTLAPTARDRTLGWAGDHWQAPAAGDPIAAAGGRSQGLALAVGAGRVVVLGEAGMLGERGLAPDARGPDGEPLDNARLALGIVRWLAEAPAER